MRVHLVSRIRPRRETPVADSLRLLTHALRDAGAEVTTDVAARPIGRDDPQRLARRMEADWSEREPDVVHAVGRRAVDAASHAAHGRFPVVGTFVDARADSARVRDAADGLDGVLALTAAECDGWRRAGCDPNRIRAFHLPVELPDRHRTGGRVILTDATGPTWRRLIDSRVHWGRGTSALRLRRVRSGSTAAVRDVCLVVATQGRRNGGLALEAARHGIPSVVLDHDDLREVIVPGVTGLLLSKDATSQELGTAVGHLLRRPLLREGFGAAARSRVGAAFHPETSARQARAAYEAAADGDHERLHLHRLPAGGDAQRAVLDHLDLARQIASRYAGRGQSFDDLLQVAYLGLVKAASRYDPTRGNAFASFAMPTVVGELRRHFRDHAWAVRVPRTLQEQAVLVHRTEDHLGAELAGAACTQAVAEETGLSRGEVVRARQARSEALSSASLDLEVDDSHTTVGDLIGETDGALLTAENRAALAQALDLLPERERRVLVLSFFGECSQSEIAEQVGVSQVHVSRILSRTLDILRRHALDGASLPVEWGAPPA